MYAPSMPSVKSRLFSCSRRAAIAFLACATIGAPNFSLTATATATATPQASIIAALAKIREAWVQDLRTKQLEPILKFYAPDAVFLQPTARQKKCRQKEESGWRARGRGRPEISKRSRVRLRPVLPIQAVWIRAW